MTNPLCLSSNATLTTQKTQRPTERPETEYQLI